MVSLMCFSVKVKVKFRKKATFWQRKQKHIKFNKNLRSGQFSEVRYKPMEIVSIISIYLYK